MKSKCENCKNCLFITPDNKPGEDQMQVVNSQGKTINWYMLPGNYCRVTLVHMHDIQECSEFKPKP